MDYLEHTAMRHVMSDELYHHGIMGQKWGVRRYQNPDGTLTSAGKKRYSSLSSSNEKLEGKIAKENANIEKRYKRMPKRYFTDIGKYRQEKAIRKIEVSNKKIREYEIDRTKLQNRMKELYPKEVPYSEMMLKLATSKGYKLSDREKKIYSSYLDERESTIKAGKDYRDASNKAHNYFAQNGGKFYESAVKHPETYKQRSQDFYIDNKTYRDLSDNAAKLETVYQSKRSQLSQTETKLGAETIKKYFGDYTREVFPIKDATKEEKRR